MPKEPPVLEPQDSPGHPLAPWFGNARRRHRARYAAQEGKPRVRLKRAVVTMVYNEPVFLPIWQRWYSRFFAPDDMYVLDNESTDGSTRGEGFVRIPVRRDAVDHTWMVRTIEGLQHELLDRYDMVLVVDVDELLTCVPEWGSLDEYLDRFDAEWVNALGYEILHLPDREPPLRLDEPVLDQRGYWFPNAAYDKAALATVPMTWKPGFHGRADQGFNLDPDLRLIHLHRMDYEICRSRHRLRARRPWADEDEREGWAVHNQLVDGENFDHWFREDSSVPNVEIKLEQIPASWRGMF